MSTPASVVIVGASLAGATTAFTLRERGFDGDIVLVSAESELPYERLALSKTYLAGDVSLDELLVRSADAYDEHRVTLRLGQPAAGLDVDRRTVRLASGEVLPYTHLVIATGASNVRPPIPGIDLDGVHQIRTVADADTLRAELPGLRTAVVVGQVFIGCEITATLTTLGVAVTAVDPGPGPLWRPLGPELSALVRRWHTSRGVRLVNDTGVSAFMADAAGRVSAVELADGRRIDAELVVVGVGVRPATEWLLDTPVHLVPGAIGVDSQGCTSLPGMYAAGDLTAPWHDELDRHVRHEHWASAVDQGRRVAHAITGTPQPVPVLPSFWCDQYDRTVQYVGSHDADCDIVLRGDLTQPDAPLLAFFLRAGRLAAVLGVNNGKELRRAQRLIGLAVDPAAMARPRRRPPQAATARPCPTLTRPATKRHQDMRPFDRIPDIKRVNALDVPAGMLDTLSDVVSKPRALRRALAGEPFGHQRTPCSCRSRSARGCRQDGSTACPAPRSPPPC
jgi:3-phenylpropionate/trans-cinnamate dioxygenase ferredoxin reductase subunit